MRIPLFAYPWRVPARRSGGPRKGSAFWRLAVFGAIWREACDCDAVKSCMVYRSHGVEPAGVDEDTGEAYEAYDPRDDCTCLARPAHTHTRLFGRLLDAPIKPSGVRGVLREAATKEPW